MIDLPDSQPRLAPVVVPARCYGSCAPAAIAALMVSLLVPRVLPASTNAFDSAADPAYNKGWLIGSNGGFGWGGPWAQPNNQTVGDPIAGGVIASSATNGNGDQDGDGDINTPRNSSGRAWGMEAVQGVEGFPSGGQANATRAFNGALSVNQTFRIDMDNGFLADPVLSDGKDHPGEVGWTLFGADPAAGDSYGVEAVAGHPDYLYIGALGGLFDSGVPLTTEGIHCELTLLDATLPFTPGWILTITPLTPGSKTTTLTGGRNGTPIVTLNVGDSAGGTDPTEAVYFNNISVGNVPEPGSAALVLIGGGSLLRRRRRGAAT